MTLRLRPLALLALLLTTGLIAGCGSSDSKSSSDSGSGGGESATSLLNKAFSTPVTSGELKLEASATLKGSKQFSGPLKATVSGPFASRGKKKAPLIDFDVAASGAGQSFTGKLIATADNAFLGFRGETYEVGTALYKRFLDMAEKNSGSNPTSVSELGLKPEEWLKDPSVKSGPSIGGDSTKQVSGGIDAEKMVRDLVDVTKSPQIKKQLQGSGKSVPKVSDADVKKVVDALENPKFEVDVDDQNHLRRLDFTTGFKRPAGETTGPTGGSVRFLIEFPKVGGTPTITAPKNAKPIQLLLQQFGGGLGAGAPGGGIQTN